ncbi:hypothetical protein CP960_06220 [Malaciobacter halophilus]|uniref:Prepilin-type cleavage/methylation domain-containing protein n=2 Tax=Malaciobacter halophilus TaxID=197482 RepID=A0A2N1J3T8_9BACT|nr:hypothetical protein CP960_06220 [Malaciobacter halophilus]
MKMMKSIFINMKYQNKKAFISLELLLVIVIASVILISSYKVVTNIYLSSKNSQIISINRLDLLSSKIILQKRPILIDSLYIKNRNLYINNSLFLQNVKNFKIKNFKNFKIVSFIYNNTQNIQWVIRL